MKNLIILLAAMMICTFAFGQIKVVAPNGDTKIGNTTIAPAGKLHVDGGNSIFTNGKVGIGTQNPVQQLDVFTDGSPASARFQARNAANGQSRIEIIKSTTGSSSIFLNLGVGGSANTLDHGYFWASSGNFIVANDGSANPTLVVSGMNDGTTGVALPSTAIDATAKLHVDGKAVKPGGGDWDTPSDKRLKKNIRDFEMGLDEVLSIEPVYFTYNGKAEIETTDEYVGVIAQDFQKIDPQSVGKYIYAPNKEFDEEGVLQSYGEGHEEYLSVNATSIKYMMVNAIQEQQEIIEQQADDISNLEDKINQLEELIRNTISQNGVELNNGDTDKASLKQNIPNPFNESTSISYTLPKDASTAKLLVYDIQGRLIKEVFLDASKKLGTVDMIANGLIAGTYTYSLFVNGNLFETKKMVIN